jgi:LysM domain
MKQNQDDSIPQFTGMKPLLGRRIVQLFTGRWRRYLPTSCAIPPAPPTTIEESWHCVPAARVLMHRERGQNHTKGGPAPKTVSPEQAAAEGEKAAKGKVRTYVVQSGDTLVSVSKKFYQTPSRWKDILDANQNQLSNPDELKVGQTIILP